MKGHLWTTMINNRLNTLTLLYVHPGIHPSSEVLQRYVALGPHRMGFD